MMYEFSNFNLGLSDLSGHKSRRVSGNDPVHNAEHRAVKHYAFCRCPFQGILQETRRDRAVAEESIQVEHPV